MVVQGYVKTSDSLPIINANVLLYQVSEPSDLLVAFTKTNNKGFYSLKIPDNNDVWTLSVRQNGFQEVKAHLERTPEGGEVIKNFFLLPTVSFLDTVRVNLKFSISNTGDTLTFNPNAYSLNNERNIEQLLSRLPGIEIKEDGKISFNGKNVDAVLLDGDDLFKKNYQVLTRNAASEIVDKIQVIKNFQKDQLLKDFGKGGGQAINLVLKDKYRKYLFGSMSAGYGSNHNKLGDLFLVKLFPGIKAQGGMNYNSWGTTYVQTDQFSPEDYFAAMKDYFSFTPASSMISIRPYYLFNIPLYYQKDNESYQITSNVLFKTKAWENLLNARFARDEINRNQSNRRMFEDGAVLTDIDSGKIMDRLWDFGWAGSKSSENESVYFKATLTAKKQLDNFNSLSNYSWSSAQALKGENLFGQAGINYYKKLGKDILWSTSLGYFSQSVQDNLTTNPDIIFWEFPGSLSSYSIKSQVKNKIRYARLKTGLAFSHKSWKHILDITFSSENRFIISSLDTTLLANIASGTAFANNSYLHDRKINLNYATSLFLKKGRLVTLGVEIGEDFYNYKTGNGVDTDGLFTYDLSMSYMIKKRNSSFNVTTGVKRMGGRNDMFVPEYVLTGFHELQSGLVDMKGTRSIYAQSNFSLTSIRLGWIAFGIMSYSHGRAYFIPNLTNIGIGTIRSIIYYPDDVNQFLILINSDKALGALPLHLKSNVTFSHNTQASSYRDNISTTNVGALRFSNQLKSHMKSVVNGDYAFSIVTSSVKTTGFTKSKSISNIFLHKANLYLTLPKLIDLTTSMTHVLNRKINFKKTFWDITVSRKFLKEKWLAEFSVRNLLGVKELVNRHLSPFYVQEQSIAIRGREFFGVLKYNIR